MEDITVWLREFITEFRKKSEELSQKERSRISNLDNFFPPCQVLLLSFQNANLQYLICTHDSNKKDMEIKIEGPIPTHDAIDKMDSILKSHEWERELSEEEKKYIYNKSITFSGLLENIFLGIIQEIRNQPFLKPSAISLVTSKRWMTSGSFLWEVVGNIAEINKTKIVTDIIEQAKKDATIVEAKPVPLPLQPLINSCATYFYPPIWIDKLPKKTFIDKARGSLIFPERALNLEYKKRIIVVNQDGLIAIGEDNIPKATRMLNEIMATFLLMGFEASAIRELEVCDAKIDPSTLSITQFGARTHTLRTQIFPFFGQQLVLEGRTEIEKYNFVKTVKLAEHISMDPDISDFLTFFLQAHSHLENSEYSQSFIMSWVIIERQILWLWKKFLKEEQMPKKRRDKLTNPAYWTIDFVLEGLNLGVRLSQNEYEDLMALKDKRNDIIHLGESTTFEEAQKCFKRARDIVKQRSGQDQG